MKCVFNLRTLVLIASFSTVGAIVAFTLKASGIVENSTLQWAIWWGATALGAGFASCPESS
jgi:hypothetical protein